jgi:hypothetical protein
MIRVEIVGTNIIYRQQRVFREATASDVSANGALRTLERVVRHVQHGFRPSIDWKKEKTKTHHENKTSPFGAFLRRSLPASCRHKSLRPRTRTSLLTILSATSALTTPNPK